jgi:hypothetical protein
MIHTSTMDSSFIREWTVSHNRLCADGNHGRYSHACELASDRIRRLALQNTGCTTEYGTASVDRSLTVPTGA